HGNVAINQRLWDEFRAAFRFILAINDFTLLLPFQDFYCAILQSRAPFSISVIVSLYMLFHKTSVSA
ncbi:hypothetical protein EWB34_24285, partial [Salmonella enterica subsp. enterica serovar Enteritidis]|nr:hypothetical protein [Salmonella enterica subsp. enterica serovar Enteritidis]